MKAIKRKRPPMRGSCEFCGKIKRVIRVYPAPQIEYMRGQSFAWACRGCAQSNAEMRVAALDAPAAGGGR